ncbi:MAG: alcohol dehydrogenase [Acidobacteria bacterium]|nr:MAG: alcohol dehydrogenase [Acidobacteriota bacterium]
MRQVVLKQPGRFEIEQAPEPVPRAGEALVRARRVGLCGTDYHAYEGRQPYFTYPRILGHELAVEVVEAPANGRGIRPGDRCAAEPYLSCGACHACRLGKSNCCERIEVLGVHTDGGMRELFTVPLDHLHRSDRLSFDQLVLVEPLGIGAHAVRRSELQAGEEVLVVGAGPIGLAILEFALAAGGRVRMVEINPLRRAFAERRGVEVLTQPDERLAEVVFDATGSVRAMEKSFECVAHGGRLVFVSVVQSAVRFDDPLFNRREMTVLSSRNSVGEFPRVIGMIEGGRMDTARWITHRLAVDDVPRRFPELPKEINCIKAVVEFD